MITYIPMHGIINYNNNIMFLIPCIHGFILKIRCLAIVVSLTTPPSLQIVYVNVYRKVKSHTLGPASPVKPSWYPLVSYGIRIVGRVLESVIALTTDQRSM